ncbi:MAG: DUF3343 domain-containing protein [Clostridia bacterium]|nr:DUF3343 domain-containing protein [Clostridia bacterium]
MIFCLAVFNSRSHTVGFIDYMRSKGIDCKAVNTPIEAHIGCGISAKFPVGQLSFARHVVSALSLTSFRGFFSIRKDGVKRYITRL